MWVGWFLEDYGTTWFRISTEPALDPAHFHRRTKIPDSVPNTALFRMLSWKFAASKQLLGNRWADNSLFPRSRKGLCNRVVLYLVCDRTANERVGRLVTELWCERVWSGRVPSGSVHPALRAATGLCQLLTVSYLNSTQMYQFCSYRTENSSKYQTANND